MTHAIQAPIRGELATSIPTDATERAIVGFLSRYHGRTFDAYRADLTIFGNWCAARNVRPLDVGRLELTMYLRWLQDQGHAQSTVARRWGTVTGFLRHAYRDELIPRNPADFVDRPTIDRAAQYRTWLSPLELASMLKVAKATSARDHLLIALMGQCGMRVGEACSLDVESVAVAEGVEVLRFIGKGNKAATIVVPLPVLRPLHLRTAEVQSGALFTTRTGRRMDRRDAARVVTRVAQHAGVDHHVTPHALRRGFANAGRYAGVERGRLQEAMRHADGKSTEIYLKRADLLTAATTQSIAAFLSGLGA